LESFQSKPAARENDEQQCEQAKPERQAASTPELVISVAAGRCRKRNAFEKHPLCSGWMATDQSPHVGNPQFV
jgi:hypothetical protein